MKRFSFITPIHKVPKTFKNCIEGFEKQNIDFEWIIVINGPHLKNTDLDVFFEKSCIKDKTKIIFRPDLIGPSSSRNIGIESANGQYLIFLDSDDYLDSSFLFFLQQRIDEIEDESFAIAANGRRYVAGKNSYGKNNLIFSSRELSKAEISLNYVGSISGFCISQNLNVRFSENLTFFEDYEVYMKIMNQGKKIYGCHQAIYNYCLDEDSLTNLIKRDNFNRIIQARDQIFATTIKNIISYRLSILAYFQISRLVYMHKRSIARFLLLSMITFSIYPPYFYFFFKRLLINLRITS